MKLRLDCVICILNQTLKTARLVRADPEMQEKILRTAMERLQGVDWEASPPRLARAIRVVDLIREFTGVGDPYWEYKRRSNDEALNLYGKAEKLIAESDDPLKAAVKVSISGNIIDVVTTSEYDLEEKIMEVLKREPAVDDYDELRRDVMDAETLLFFSDNAGEIVFDKLLIEEMNRVRGKPFRKITFVAKGGPFLNDATLEDAVYVGVNKLPNTEIRTVSNGSLGTGPDPSSSEVLGWINSSDLVIAKGQGNYEEYSHLGGVYFLLIAKCPVVAMDLGVSVGDIIIKKGG